MVSLHRFQSKFKIHGSLLIEDTMAGRKITWKEEITTGCQTAICFVDAVTWLQSIKIRLPSRMKVWKPPKLTPPFLIKKKTQPERYTSCELKIEHAGFPKIAYLLSLQTLCDQTWDLRKDRRKYENQNSCNTMYLCVYIRVCVCIFSWHLTSSFKERSGYAPGKGTCCNSLTCELRLGGVRDVAKNKRKI